MHNHKNLEDICTCVTCLNKAAKKSNEDQRELFNEAILNAAVRDICSVENRAKSRVRRILINYTRDILK